MTERKNPLLDIINLVASPMGRGTNRTEVYLATKQGDFVKLIAREDRTLETEELSMVDYLSQTQRYANLAGKEEIKADFGSKR